MGDSVMTTEVGSTDDIVRALLDYLVDPLLPLKPSSVRGTPSISQHESVAKQMHATVLLYNFYQRNHPELQYIDFESFCKLFVTLKPSLTLYMKSTPQLDPAKLYEYGNQLSLTEKAIMNACSLSRTLLDASEDISRSIKEWPIIKIAVLLVDSTKENCLLLFGSVTNGIWSVIEKDIDSESLVVGSKRKRFKTSKSSFKEQEVDDEAGFQNAAFLAVKEITCINRTELKVLESNVVYTLSKEKTAARFYILQSTQAISEDCKVLIKDAIDSLQGPLVSKCSGSWMVTPAVEYFHLLPYAGIISDWFSREVLFNSMDDKAGTETVDFRFSWNQKKTCKWELEGEVKGVTSNSSHNVNVGLDSVMINSLSIDKPCDMEVIETRDSSDKCCTNLDGGKKALIENKPIENPCEKKVVVPEHCSDKHESTDKSCVILDGGNKGLVTNEEIENPSDKKVMVPEHCSDKHENTDKSCVILDGGKKLVAIEEIENPCDKKGMVLGHCSDKYGSPDKSCIILDGGEKSLVANEAIENPCDKKVMVPGHCGDKDESADKSHIILDGVKKALVANEAVENLCDKKVMVHGQCSDKHESTDKSCIILDGCKKTLVGNEEIETPCDKKVMVPCSDKHEITDKSCIILDGGKKALVANEAIENPCNKKVMVPGHSSDKDESADKSHIILDEGKKALVANEAIENPCDKEVMVPAHCGDKHECADISCINVDGGKKAMVANEAIENPCNKKVMVPGHCTDKHESADKALVASEATENLCDSKVMVPGYCSDKNESADKSRIILNGGKKALVANEEIGNPCDKKVMVPGHCSNKHESADKSCIILDRCKKSVVVNEAIDNPCDKKVMVPEHSSDKHEIAEESCTILDGGKKVLVANEAVEKLYNKKVMTGHNSDKHESVAIESPGQKKFNESHMVDIFNSTSGPQSMNMDENPVGSLPKEKITTGSPIAVKVYRYQKRRRTSTPSVDCYSNYSTNGMKNQAEQVTNLKMKLADLKTESCPSEFRNEKVDTEKVSSDVSQNLHGARTEDRSLVSFKLKTSYEEKVQVTESCLSELQNEKVDTELSSNLHGAQTEDRSLVPFELKTSYEEKVQVTESCPSEFQNEMVDTEKVSCDVSRNQHAARTEERSLVPFELKTSFKEKVQVTESCPNEFQNEKVYTKKVSSQNLHRARTEERSLVPFELKTDYEEKVQVTLASKEAALSQTALRVLVRKREKLCNELHNLEEEMAVCERNIRAILNGAENNLAIKLEAVLDCCNDMCFQSKAQAQCGMNQDADNQGLLQYPMGKKLSEAILSVRTPCQELNDICCANNWMLPIFHVTPCDGGYLGNVTVKGLDFECSCGSDLRPTPDGARNMAAERIIDKLQDMASQLH